MKIEPLSVPAMTEMFSVNKLRGLNISVLKTIQSCWREFNNIARKMQRNSSLKEHYERKRKQRHDKLGTGSLAEAIDDKKSLVFEGALEIEIVWFIIF